jgi:integrase
MATPAKAYFTARPLSGEPAVYRQCHSRYIDCAGPREKRALRRLPREYRNAARVGINWMEMHGRIERNPMRSVQKAHSNGKRVYSRRAFTGEEVKRLLAVAGSRKAVYLTAVFTGLRRGKLAALEWGDVHLDSLNPFLNVRASTTKPPASSDPSASGCGRGTAGTASSTLLGP